MPINAKAAILAGAIIRLANIVVAMIAIAVVDHVGRRIMLLISTAGMAVALALIGIAFQQHWGGTVMLYVVIAYCVAFGIGLGPVMWLLISEIYPTKIRGKAMRSEEHTSELQSRQYLVC